jgi:uncharacterized protein YggT (Ycf19 family)
MDGSYFIYFIVNLVRILLFIVQAAMLFRAILSWFFMEDDTRVMSILYAVTEPFIVPIRALFEKMGWFRNLPIDISFFVTYILLSIISMML